ncbi:oxalate:formate antiporter-like [Haliotis rufescens]|uniref:oxalate:formate antiporter-like n=1 Tax=Haliotis rufescens TaxID=6454 RepID=UPI001EB07CE1|nr:oxalate:formate antiporter-like [Haliotis rufescens]
MACGQWRAYLVVWGGLMVHLTLGTVFSFGNLTPYLTSYLRNNTSSLDIDYGDSMWIYACCLMGQGAAIFLGGIISRTLGLKLTVLLGSWFMSAGVMLTFITVRHSYIGVIFTYGVMNGLGCGVAYPLPMGCAMKWLPERKGLAGGLVVAGFGGGAFIFNLVQTAFINPDNLSPDLKVNGEHYFSQPELLQRVPWVFVLTGGIYAAMQLVGVLLLSDPPTQATSVNNVSESELDSSNNIVMTNITVNSDSNDRNVSPVNPKETISVVESLRPLQVLKTRAFYTLWLCFLFNGQGVVFLSSLYKDYGQTFITNDVFLAVSGAFASAFNFSGRMFWGFIADRFSFKTAMMCMCTSFSCLMITFNVTPLGGEALYFIYVCLLFGTLAGNYSLFSVAAARSFGEKYYPINFGLIFTSQTITAPLGAILASQLKAQIGWFGMFSLIAGFSFLSLLLITTFNVKNSKGRPI